MRFEAMLKEKGMPFQRSVHPSAYTSQGLAALEHVSGYHVAKPVIVKGRKEFAMCVVSACDRVDLSRIAELLHEPQVRLATETEMANLFWDCELGAEPPVGSIWGLKTILDEPLHGDEYLVMQSGRHTDSVRLRREDYERLCDPVVATISLQ
ncbi:MAG: YbaK/EbsC family protein [Planctomycetota bacterium]